jgi:osomolarity two-component system response regulator SSK1
MVRFSLSRPFFRRKQSAPATLHHSHSSLPDTDTTSVASTAAHSSRSADPTSRSAARTSRRRASSLHKPRSRQHAAEVPEPVPELRESFLLAKDADQADSDEKSPQLSTDNLPTPSSAADRSGSDTLAEEAEHRSKPATPDTAGSPPVAGQEPQQREINGEDVRLPPQLVVQAPTPITEEVRDPTPITAVHKLSPLAQQQSVAEQPVEGPVPLSEPPSSQISPRHDSTQETEDRRQNIVDSANAKIVKSLVDAPAPKDPYAPDTNDSTALPSAVLDLFTPGLPNMTTMVQRKIWVKRPGGSATLVQIKDDDLVDDVRDMILRKYANSLGKTFDSPDMLLRIVSRGDHGQPRTDRVLGPEEAMCRTLDSYFPGGQLVDDALVIDVPPKRTPRPSPRYQYQAYPMMEDQRPVESGTEYFPPMPAIVHPVMPGTAGSHDSRPSQHGEQHHRSMSVLNTGQLPLIPSPGGTRRHPERMHRPRFNRQQTSSPTILQHHPSSTNAVAVAANGTLAPQQQVLSHRGALRPRTESISSEHPNPHHPNGVSAPVPMPTPPAAEKAATSSNPPTPSSGQPTHQQRPPRPKKSSRKPLSGGRSRKDRNGSSNSPQPLGISSMLDASIPPINVLIVEDNIINLRILEGLMKRLKVRWETAMNGQIAVDKWRGGGFHLVLMDIQMPVMNGLQATKEIRRLEKVNGIGVFSTSPLEHRKSNGVAIDSNDGTEDEAEIKRKKSADKLPEAAGGMFKSPIIIVALTASSLQSDRHEALAAGCNDFLTKPVNFVWLERKVKEWGCMQALIDFDGWRRWKDYASKEEAGKTEEQKREEKEKDEKQKRKMEKLAILQEKQRVKREAEEAKKKAEREKAEQEAAAAAPAEENGGADEKDEAAAEVEQEKKEIEMGDKALEQEEANPGPDREPPALAPETIAEE